MIAQLTAHLLATTVAALAAIAAAWALGRGPARWRYAILLAALLRFAVPTAWLAAAGSSLAAMLPARAPQAMEDLGRLLSHPGPLAISALPAAAGHFGGGLNTLLLLLWAAGAAVCLWPWTRQWRIQLAAVRRPRPDESEAFERACQALGIQDAMELRIVDADRVPGALGYWRPAVVLPDGLSAQLSASELEAVLAHELAHILRRDNLWAAIAHAIVAAFWFHPLVWWLERRMLKERETASDELVLGRGTQPEVYLSGILKVCRMAFRGAEGYAGANGSSLEIRMERIMSANVPRGSYWSRALAGALMAMAALFPLAGGYLKAQPQSAGAPTGESQKLFDDGKASFAHQDFQAAENAFRRAYEADPRNAKAAMGVAEVFITRGRMDDAVSFMQKQAAAHPESQDLQLALGNIEVRAGQYDLAVAQFQKLIDKTGHNGEIYLRLGETYRRMNDMPQAIAALHKAVELQPDSPPAWATLALTLDAAGRLEEAEKAYRKMLGLDPKNAVALNNLAYLLASHGRNLDEALDYAQQARKALPEMTEVLDTVGYIYLAKKSPQDAYGAFREAVLKNPGDRNYRSHLLAAIEQLSDRSATAESLRTALREAPTGENQELLKKLLQ